MSWSLKRRISVLGVPSPTPLNPPLTKTLTAVTTVVTCPVTLDWPVANQSVPEWKLQSWWQVATGQKDACSGECQECILPKFLVQKGTGLQDVAGLGR